MRSSRLSFSAVCAIAAAVVAVLPFAAAASGASSPAITSGECLAKTLAFQLAHLHLQGRAGSDAVIAADLDFPAGCTPPTFDDAPTEGGSARRPGTAALRGASAAAAFYVDTSGNDGNSGSAAQPFRSLGRAQQAVRSLSAADRAGATVNVRAGTYYETLLFTEADNGASGSPVVWQAENGAAAVISGGAALPCSSAGDWSPAGGALPSGVLKCSVPSSVTSFDELFLDGVRATRARTPNGDPMVPKDGYTACGKVTGIIGGHAQQLPQNGKIVGSDGKTVLDTVSILPTSDAIVVNVTDTDTVRTIDNCKQAQTLYQGTRYNESNNRFPFWNVPCPSGFSYAQSSISWPTDPTGAVVKMMHPSGWGSWGFEVANGSSSAVMFGRGGDQEARGGGSCGNFYMENHIEFLDVEGEWFFDAAAHTLYYYPVDGQVPSRTEVSLNSRVIQFRGSIPSRTEVSLNSRVIQFRGSMGAPVAHITFHGFNITHAAPTYLESYEVPSGGDWSVHRGAAVFVDGAEDITLDTLNFDQVGGNGVFLSDYVRYSSVLNSNFWITGDTGVLAVGTTSLANGTALTYPAHNTISNNWFSTVGYYMKQTACYFKSITYNNTITNNVCHNGPRAGVNYNDGFMGGDLLSGNVFFNMVRETGDNGNFNSWDRRTWFYSCDGSGQAPYCYTPKMQTISHNVFIGIGNDYNVDHDDGSSQYTDAYNLVWLSGFKYRDGVNRIMTGNFMIDAGPIFQVTGFNKDFYFNNTQLTGTGSAPRQVCGPTGIGGISGTTYITIGNTSDTLLMKASTCDAGTQVTLTWQEAADMARKQVFP